MEEASPFAITISRQLGSGGAYIGQTLADMLNVHCANHDIIDKVAARLAIKESDLAIRDEKLQSLWKLFEEYSALAMDVPIPNRTILPTSRELYDAEAEVIKQIANEHSAVIVGRCGFHILRNHPRKISILLHANTSFRCQRLQDQMGIDEKAAMQLIEKCDKERSAYIETFTGHNWMDASAFDLSIDTSKVGIKKSIEIIMCYLSCYEF